MMRFRQGLTLSFAAIVMVAVAGCKDKKAAEDDTTPTANLKVETVHLQNVAGALEIPGRVEADPQHLVHIYAPLSGRLMNFNLVVGQQVKKGQPIAMLQSADVAAARSDFEKARIEVLRADHALQRGQILVAHDVLSQADFQELKATDDAAHSEQERARQRVHELGFSENGTSDMTAITSPISGTVLDVATANGEMQRSLDNANGIATVADLTTVWVTGDLFERDFGVVKSGEDVDVLISAYPNETLRGKVANIGDALDPTTHAVKVRVVMSNPGYRLKPQMFATLKIDRAAQQRIVLPLAAVLHQGDETDVYVPAGNGKYLLRKVQIGATHGETVEITGGLRDGEQVVTQGAAFLRQPVGD